MVGESNLNRSRRKHENDYFSIPDSGAGNSKLDRRRANDPAQVAAGVSPSRSARLRRSRVSGSPLPSSPVSRQAPASCHNCPTLGNRPCLKAEVETMRKPMLAEIMCHIWAPRPMLEGRPAHEHFTDSNDMIHLRDHGLRPRGITIAASDEIKA